MNKKYSKVDKSKKEEIKREPMTKEQATEMASKLSAEGSGKYVIAAATAGQTRLILKDMKKDTKEPLFRLFCVSWDKASMEGLVLAKIDSFRVDKNSNVYMVAKPVLPLRDVKGVFKNSVWDFVLPYGIMWKPYGEKRDIKHERFNVSEAYSKLGYEKGENEAETRAKMWEDMVSGKFTFADLSKALNTKTSYEIGASRLYKDWQTDKLDDLPYLVARLDREEMGEKALIEFCEKEHEAYVRLGLKGAKNIAEEANSVIKYYIELHAAEKEAKKAKKNK